MKRAGWDAAFDAPIELPEGGSLKTLRDAADYIQRLPAAEQQHEKVQTAVHVLIQAADHDGPMMFARIGVSAMLGRHDPPMEPRSPRRPR